MITIRPDQMQMFAERRRTTFTQRVAAYLREHTPEAKDLPPPELTVLIQRQTAAAALYDIKTEAAVVQFIEIGLTFGEEFHSTGEFPAAERILASELDGPLKMQELLALAKKGLGGAA